MLNISTLNEKELLNLVTKSKDIKIIISTLGTTEGFEIIELLNQKFISSQAQKVYFLENYDFSLLIK